MKFKAILLAMILFGTLAMAQDPTPPPPPPGNGPGMGMMGGRGFGMGMGGWWKNSQIAQQLNLTDQQKQQLEQTFTQYRLQLIDLRASVEREETKLQPLMDADQFDKAKISSQLDSLIAARMKLEKTAAMMHVSMREILSPEQWKQLQSIHAQHRGMDRGKGFGRGMGRPRQGPPPANTTPAPGPGTEQ